MTVSEKDAVRDYFRVDDVEGLLSLVQLGVLEIHTWNSLADDYDRPDRVIFDLDPGEDVSFADVVDRGRPRARRARGAGARRASRRRPAGGGCTSSCRSRSGTTTMPSAAGRTRSSRRWRPTTRRCSPRRCAKDLRPGRVFVDYLRNAHGATAVCAFSTRARPGAPVSVPVSWKELTRGLDPRALDTASVPRRLAALKTDPWEGYEAARRELDGALFTALGLEAPHP